MKPLNSLIKLNLFSPTERLILKTFNAIRENIEGFLAEKDPSSLNPHGEISRGFDKKISEWLIEYLRKQGFRGTIVTEEKIDVGENETIYIDPIDGSLNAARGIPLYGMTIALSEKEKQSTITFGLVWVIPEDTVIIGNKNAIIRITKEEKLTKISESPNTKDPDTIIETGDTTGEALKKIKKKYSIRHFGSISYAFAKMIEGVIDGIFDNSGKLKLTDIAAFIPILEKLKVPYHIEQVKVGDGNVLNPRVKFVASIRQEVFQSIKILL